MESRLQTTAEFPIFRGHEIASDRRGRGFAAPASEETSAHTRKREFSDLGSGLLAAGEATSEKLNEIPGKLPGI